MGRPGHPRRSFGRTASSAKGVSGAGVIAGPGRAGSHRPRALQEHGPVFPERGRPHWRTSASGWPARPGQHLADVLPVPLQARSHPNRLLSCLRPGRRTPAPCGGDSGSDERQARKEHRLDSFQAGPSQSGSSGSALAPRGAFCQGTPSRGVRLGIGQAPWRRTVAFAWQRGFRPGKTTRSAGPPARFPSWQEIGLSRSASGPFASGGCRQSPRPNGGRSRAGSRKALRAVGVTECCWQRLSDYVQRKQKSAACCGSKGALLAEAQRVRAQEAEKHCGLWERRSAAGRG